MEEEYERKMSSEGNLICGILLGLLIVIYLFKSIIIIYLFII
jgi:hypothetical protein